MSAIGLHTAAADVVDGVHVLVGRDGDAPEAVDDGHREDAAAERALPGGQAGHVGWGPNRDYDARLTLARLWRRVVGRVAHVRGRRHCAVLGGSGARPQAEPVANARAGPHQGL